MATVNLTRGSATVGNHVGGKTRRVPYSVERIVDFADAVAAKGSALTSGDVIQVIPVPANTLLHGAIAEVLEVTASTAATFNLDVAGGDDFVDGGDLTTLGYVAVGTNGLAPFGANTVLPTSAEDTIDMTLIAPGAVALGSDCRVRVVAYMSDASEVDGPDEVSRNQLA